MDPQPFLSFMDANPFLTFLIVVAAISGLVTVIRGRPSRCRNCGEENDD